MLTILAAICFFLALLGVGGPIDLTVLGLMLLAIHLAYPVGLPLARR